MSARFWFAPLWTFSLRTLLLVIGVAAVPLGLGVNHLHRERLRRMLAQPIIDAAEIGDAESIRQLLDRGADVNSIANGRFPWTPLMHAAFRGHPDAVRLLLDRGANLDHECLDGFTALTLAAGEEHWEIVRLLADRGGDVGHRDATGKSAFSLAERADQSELLEAFRLGRATAKP